MGNGNGILLVSSLPVKIVHSCPLHNCPHSSDSDCWESDWWMEIVFCWSLVYISHFAKSNLSSRNIFRDWISKRKSEFCGNFTKIVMILSVVSKNFPISSQNIYFEYFLDPPDPKWSRKNLNYCEEYTPVVLIVWRLSRDCRLGRLWGDANMGGHCHESTTRSLITLLLSDYCQHLVTTNSGEMCHMLLNTPAGDVGDQVRRCWRPGQGVRRCWRQGQEMLETRRCWRQG